MAKILRPHWGLWPAALSVTLASCTVDEIPAGANQSPDGPGPIVRHQLYPEDLKALPLPNDLLAVPDPTSQSGLRLNFSLDAASPVEVNLRQALNQLDGWGLFAPITVSFDDEDEAAAPAVDLLEIRARHAADPRDPSDDSLYVINLRTGIPAPIELGPGSFQYLARDKSLFPEDDPRRFEPAVEVETADERADAVSGQVDTALTEYSASNDTDFDGWLDRPNLLRTEPCATQVRVQNGEVSEVVRDTCIADSLMPWYEREDDTLIVRPLVPLEPGTRYAVVLTDRLVDVEGNPVQSPFATVHHPADISVAGQVQAILGDVGARAWYGDIAGTGLEHVAFVWAFTTGSPVDELRTVRDGLHGHGKLADLAESHPAELRMARTVGPVAQSAIDEGESPPDGWERTDACAPLVDRPFVVDAGTASEKIAAVPLAQIGLRSERERAQLVASLAHLDYLAIGEYASPFLIEGGPGTKDVTGGFRLDVQTGESHASTDRVQAWFFVPQVQAGLRGPPFDVALYAHASGGSVIDALPVAGSLARLGLATVAFQAPWHGPSKAAQKLISTLMSDCYLQGSTSALASRVVDLDGDGDVDNDLGARIATANIPHGRDVLRQAVVDGVQLVRILGSFDGETTGQDLDDDGEADLAGDFDADGTIDLGGPDALYTAWGQSLGGHVVTLLGPLEPKISAIAAVGSWGNLVDGWVRTGASRAHATFLGPWLGPWIVGIPDGDPARTRTRCLPNEISLRLVGALGGEIAQTEFQCLNLGDVTDGAGLPNGGTAVIINITRGERRCTRIGPAGGFRIPFPAEVDDRLQLTIWDEPDIVDSYSPQSECEVHTESEPVAKIFTWGAGLVADGTVDDSGLVVCNSEAGCSRFGDRYFPAGAPLTAPVSGAGLGRGTPELRRLLALARHVSSSADAVTYARHFAAEPLPTASGEPSQPTSALLVVPLAAREIPVDVQVSTARAMGLVPFITPTASTSRPEWAEYSTPSRLFEELSGVTPNRLLIGSSVLEGLPYLERAIPPGECGANELPVESAPECHPSCTTDADCPSYQSCDTGSGFCRANAPEPAVCRQAQFDVDALDEGLSRFGEREAPVPLRLTRVAAPVADVGLDEVWEPRLVGTPRGPDLGAWAADKPTLALVMPYLDVSGRDTIAAPDPCAAFDADVYLTNLIGRFLATGGLDPYHVSHPSTHQCLERGDCPFLE
jgi:hypothetical protein